MNGSCGHRNHMRAAFCTKKGQTNAKHQKEHQYKQAAQEGPPKEQKEKNEKQRTTHQKHEAQKTRHILDSLCLQNSRKAGWGIQQTRVKNKLPHLSSCLRPTNCLHEKEQPSLKANAEKSMKRARKTTHEKRGTKNKNLGWRHKKQECRFASSCFASKTVRQNCKPAIEISLGTKNPKTNALILLFSSGHAQSVWISIYSQSHCLIRKCEARLQARQR